MTLLLYKCIHCTYNFSYEKIRVVGKGAFGNAVLYRRKDDGLMCIIKVLYVLFIGSAGN